MRTTPGAKKGAASLLLFAANIDLSSGSKSFEATDRPQSPMEAPVQLMVIKQA